ncbi:MAG: VWA domain-containing protein [Verrucomicrobiae bacterium]|nr:VWA domain-containing protein [Verrucomicrobiae bacterium]MDW8343228.1 VWA domain-containing protein [Verrucomicrobiae bacterium]
MKRLFSSLKFLSVSRRRDGQTLPMTVLMVIVLFMFVGLGIDVTFAYITRAALSKAVDAACLGGIRSLHLGQPAALQVARSTFDMNYADSKVAGRQTAPPTVTPVFSTSPNGNVQLTVTASVPIQTFFLRVIPMWRTFTVSVSAQATRARVALSLILDRSGSMVGNGGAAALPGAVATFIDQFDESIDRAGMVSFASHATMDFNPIQSPFKTAIKNAANTMQFVGATFSPGGMTNAMQQLYAVPVTPTEDVVRVCVFFTDGWANTIQARINCPDPRVYNIGGNAPTEGTYIAFVNPANGTILCGGHGATPDTPVNPTGCGCTATTFRSEIDGTQKAFTRRNLSTEAEYQCIRMADRMRQDGIIVYALGLGSETSINRNFLRRLANDPSTPGHVPTFYDGEALFAPTAAQLQQVFEALANKIILRLTQ